MKCTWNTVFLIPLLNAPYNRHPVWHLRNQPFWPPTAAWKSILNRPKSAPKCHASFYLKQYEPSNEFKIRSCLKTAIMHTSFKLAWAANMKNWQRKKWCMHYFFHKIRWSFYRSENNRRDKERICTYNENLGYVIYSSCGSFYVPLLVILYTYARIILVVRRRNIEFEQVRSLAI